MQLSASISEINYAEDSMCNDWKNSAYLSNKIYEYSSSESEANKSETFLELRAYYISSWQAYLMAIVLCD